MLISVDNLHCTLELHTPGERRWLSQYLAFEDPKARFRKDPHNDRDKMYDGLNNRFPTGFLPLVRRAALAEGWKLDVLDRRRAPCAADPDADLSWLRDYQRAAVDAVLGAGGTPPRERGLWHIPTGGGKTECAIGLSQALPCRWLFLVHRSNLMHQAADRYEQRTGLAAGRVGEGAWSVPGDCRFVAATFQTLHAGLQRRRQNALDLLRGAEGMLADEVHVVPADTYWRVTMATPSAYWRIGFSGTPLQRGDNRGSLAVAALGPVIYRIRAGVLIDAGVLARPRIRMVPLAQDCDNPTWQGVYGKCVVRSAERNGLLTRLCEKAEKPCLLFVKELGHGREMVRRLGRAGMRAEFTHGGHSSEWRKNLIRALERGALDVLVSSVVLQEGVDIPSLASLVIGAGGKSAIAALQRLGRGTRTDQGRKTEFTLWDVKDAGNPWLVRHSRERVRAYLSEGFEVVEGQ